MKAKRTGKCAICRRPTRPGEEIEVFLKRWVHQGCKLDEIAKRTAETAVLHGVTVVPMDYEPTKEFVATNSRIRQRRR